MSREIEALKRQVASLQRRIGMPTQPSVPSVPLTLTPSQIMELARSDAATQAALPAWMREQLRAARARPVRGEVYDARQVAVMDAMQRAGRYNRLPVTEVKDPDGTGRRVSRFYGNPAATWAPFKHHR